MDDIRHPLPSKPTRFMDQLRYFIRSMQLAYKTEKTYCNWIKNYLRYHRMKHSASMGSREVDDYLSYLAVQRNLSVNSKKQL